MQSLIIKGAWEIQQWKYKSVHREYNLKNEQQYVELICF